MFYNGEQAFFYCICGLQKKKRKSIKQKLTDLVYADATLICLTPAKIYVFFSLFSL
jgi:hypothetical protein